MNCWKCKKILTRDNHIWLKFYLYQEEDKEWFDMVEGVACDECCGYEKSSLYLMAKAKIEEDELN